MASISAQFRHNRFQELQDNSDDARIEHECIDMRPTEQHIGEEPADKCIDPKLVGKKRSGR